MKPNTNNYYDEYDFMTLDGTSLRRYKERYDMTHEYKVPHELKASIEEIKECLKAGYSDMKQIEEHIVYLKDRSQEIQNVITIEKEEQMITWDLEFFLNEMREISRLLMQRYDEMRVKEYDKKFV